MTYKVKVGDTLYGISNQFGVSVTELASLNGIKGSLLKVGQEIKIPNKSGTNPDTMFMYTVKSGDTLYSIARKYNTTPDKIKSLNYLTSNNLKIGDILRIPEMYTKEEDMVMPTFVNYMVKSGDTLYGIAKKYNSNVDTIIKDNNLTSNNLKVGSILKIRTSNEGVSVLECFGDGLDSEGYVVKKGDTLYSIARMFNTSVQEIKRKNNLKSDSLSIGQELLI